MENDEFLVEDFGKKRNKKVKFLFDEPNDENEIDEPDYEYVDLLKNIYNKMGNQVYFTRFTIRPPHTAKVNKRTVYYNIVQTCNSLVLKFLFNCFQIKKK